MGRSIKKGPFVELHLLEKIQKAKDTKQKTPIKTWSRRSMITPDFVGLTFTVHKTWSVTGWVNFPRRGYSRNTAPTRPRRRRNSIMQVFAILKNVPMSAQKMREVVRQIQGMPALEARAVLKFVPRKGARLVAKTLDSAIANAENNNKLKADTLRVKEAVAGTATTIKRFMPKARGSAGPILKRRCHIKITLSDE
jgi:large subunit ribosomal protein L22